MSKAQLYHIVDAEGLLGLYRRGLFNPVTCDYEGTALQDYWEHCGLPPLKGMRYNEKT